jgi:hypothetical protein
MFSILYASSAPADALPGFSSFLREPFTAARFRADPRATYMFLLAFRETMR